MPFGDPGCVPLALLCSLCRFYLMVRPLEGNP